MTRRRTGGEAYIRLHDSFATPCARARWDDVLTQPRAQALDFLESIPLNFLADIRESLGTLNRRDQLRKETTKKAASRKKRKVPGDEDAEDVSGEGHGAGDGDMGRGDGEDDRDDGMGRDRLAMQQVGINMRLKNWKTGCVRSRLTCFFGVGDESLS